MRFAFCVACGAKEDLQHHHLVTKKEGGTDHPTNLITLCFFCHLKLNGRRRTGRIAPAKVKRALQLPKAWRQAQRPQARASDPQRSQGPRPDAKPVLRIWPGSPPSHARELNDRKVPPRAAGPVRPDRNQGPRRLKGAAS